MARFDTNPPAGTRDFLPAEVAFRDATFATIRDVFRRHGFLPMDTPSFERIDVLLGKYGDEGDQLVFKILKRGDTLLGTEDVSELADLALRYDLTVPLARYVAKHGGTLGMPFKRSCIAPVWRADRPAKGRFREFIQCDVDTVGSDSRLADAEVLVAVTTVLDELGLTGFTLNLNSRDALRGLIEAYGVPEALESTALVAIDKLDKIGADGVASEMRERGVPAAAVEALTDDLGADDIIDRMRERIASTDRGASGLAEVDRVLELAGPHLRGEHVFAPVLARGLSYYTGPIFEITAPGLDVTLAGGGRYDGLIGMFSNGDIPATGGSIGIERVLLLLAEQEAAVAAAAPVMVAVFDVEAEPDAMAVATSIRAAGVDCDLAVGGGKLGKQLKVADRNGARFVVIRGRNEREAGTATVKELATGEQAMVDLVDLPAWLDARVNAVT